MGPLGWASSFGAQIQNDHFARSVLVRARIYFNDLGAADLTRTRSNINRLIWVGFSGRTTTTTPTTASEVRRERRRAQRRGQVTRKQVLSNH